MIIYKITNLKNGKIYIGKTEKTIEERFQAHVYNASRSNTYLARAMRKHGFNNFEIEILEHTLNLNEREKYWIKTLTPEYNMTDGGDGGNTSASPNYRKSMKEYHDNRSRETYASYGMKNKKHALDTKHKIGNANKTIWKNYTDEDRKKRASKISGEKNGMFGKTPSNSLKLLYNGICYNSLAQAHRETGRSIKYLKKHGEII